MLGREDVEWSVLPRVVSKPQHASARLRRVFVRGVLGAAALSRARILALCGPEHARHGADAEMWVRHGTQSGKRSSSNGSSTPSNTYHTLTGAPPLAFVSARDAGVT